jgi:hypothetical protein
MKGEIMHTPFDPEHVYVQLLDSADAVPDDVDAGFWQQIGN